MTISNTPSPTPWLRLSVRAVSVRAVGLLAAGAIASAAASPALADRVIDYPDGGVTLGQGWSSNAVEASPARCIVFVKAESHPGQQTRMDLKEVTSSYQLQRSLDIDASVQYKGIAAQVKGKASFAQDLTLDGSYSNISAYATVDDGRTFVAPPDADQAERVASLLRDGRTPDEVVAALGIDPRALGRRYETLLPGLVATDIRARQGAADVERMNAAAQKTAGGDPDYPGAIVLHPTYAAMAKTDPAGFRRTCGDSYVASISKGGEIVAVFTFATKSRDQQRKIAASMEGSGWGVTASAGMKQKIAELARSSKLTINWFQSGGSGSPLPTDLDSFNSSLTAFPAAVAAAPWNYKIELKTYEKLPNWPHGADAPQRQYADMDAVAFHHGKWSMLNEDLKTILAETGDPLGRSQGYLLGRGVSRAPLLAMQKDVQTRLAAIEDALSACGGNPSAEGCMPGALLARLKSSPSKPVSDDYALRAKLPPPVTSNPARPTERFLPAANLRESVFDFWLARTNAARCRIGNDPQLCWPQADLEALKASISVSAKIVVTLVSGLAAHDHCFNVNNNTNRVNYSAPCSLGNTNQQYVWDSNAGTLKHVASGKCLNVRGGGKGNGAEIIVFRCQKTSLHNDKWILMAGDRGGYLLKARHSGKCVSVPDPIRTGRGLVQQTCNRAHQRQNWMFVGG